MTPEEMRRLVALVAEELRRLGALPETSIHDLPPEVRRAAPWLPIPVRPESLTRSAAPPVWTGAAQALGDIAPSRSPRPSAHRDDLGAATGEIRAAAAGKGTVAGRPHLARAAGLGPDGVLRPSATRRKGAFPLEVPVAVSNRHVHLSEPDLRRLFGAGALSVHRPLSQPGQFAAREKVTLEGPRGRIEHVRVVGPPRASTQVEIASSDARRLGLTPPVAVSGALEESVGITLIGPNGRMSLERGVIIAARHLHVALHDAVRWGLAEGDRLSVRCGSGPRAVRFEHVVVRTGDRHATELHLDVDEAHAAGLSEGGTASIVAWEPAVDTHRPLVTERDVVDLVRRGAPIPAGALLTPSARDRARALGLPLP